MSKQEAMLQQEDFFYPAATSWMWNYCVPLGKYTDSCDRNYDLGILLNEYPSAAIVYGNEPGQYNSHELQNYFKITETPELVQSPMYKEYAEKYIETIQRAKKLGLIEIVEEDFGDGKKLQYYKTVKNANRK